MTKPFKISFLISTALVLGAVSLAANAQSYGPGPGGMMGEGYGGGWGMGWGMGGFGGFGLLLLALLVVGFAFLAFRRRNS